MFVLLHRLLCVFVPLLDEGEGEETVENPLVLWTFETQRLLRYPPKQRILIYDILQHNSHMDVRKLFQGR